MSSQEQEWGNYTLSERNSGDTNKAIGGCFGRVAIPAGRDCTVLGAGTVSKRWTRETRGTLIRLE